MATAEVSAAPATATTTPWRGVLRRLLLARRQGAREAAFKELAEIYDETWMKHEWPHVAYDILIKYCNVLDI